MQTITLEAPRNPMRLTTNLDSVSMWDAETWEVHGSAFRCFGELAPFWLCEKSLKDQDGRKWSTVFYSVPDDFGNLIEVPR